MKHRTSSHQLKTRDLRKKKKENSNAWLEKKEFGTWRARLEEWPRGGAPLAVCSCVLRWCALPAWRMARARCSVRQRGTMSDNRTICKPSFRLVGISIELGSAFPAGRSECR